jgi:hypothetical protein
MAAPGGGPITRDGARDEARRELSRDVYGGHHHQPGWLHRVIDFIDRQLGKIFDWINPHVHGPRGNYSGLGVFAGLIVLAALAVVLRLWLGPVRRSARSTAGDTDLASTLSATALRGQAEEFAQAGRYADAIRSRLRAIVRMLEEKGVLDPRASRTAGELVTEMELITTTGRDELRLAVGIFSDVWYGGRPAHAGGYEAVVRADDALASVRRGAGRPAEPIHAVPA